MKFKSTRDQKSTFFTMPQKKVATKRKKTLPPHRVAVIEALEKKFVLKSAEIVEMKIWKMCEGLCEEGEDIDEVYIRYAYEKVGCILAVKSKEARKLVLKDIKNGVIDWNSSNYDDFQRRREINNKQISEGVKVEKGEFKCRNKDCRSNECYYYQSQNRSADEGQTTYVTCTKCSARFKFN